MYIKFPNLHISSFIYCICQRLYTFILNLIQKCITVKRSLERKIIEFQFPAIIKYVLFSRLGALTLLNCNKLQSAIPKL